MRLIFLAYCSLAIAVSAFETSSAGSVGKQLTESARRADAVTIEFYTLSGMEEVTFSEPEWLDQLARILEASAYSRRGHCMCISYPQIHLYRKNEKIGTLSVHHGEKLRAYVGSVSGDFFVGEKVGHAIQDLAIGKRRPKAAEPAPGVAKQ